MTLYLDLKINKINRVIIFSYTMIKLSILGNSLNSIELMLFNAIRRKILKTSLSQKCREKIVKGLQSVNNKTHQKNIDKKKFTQKLCMKFLDIAQNFLNGDNIGDFTEAIQLISKLLLDISPLHISYHSIIIKTRIASLKLHSLHIYPNVENKSKLVKISIERAECFAQQLSSCIYYQEIKKDYYSSLEILYLNLVIFNILFTNYQQSMKYLQQAKQTLKLQITQLNEFMNLQDRKVFELIKEKTRRMEQTYCLQHYLKKKMNITIKSEELKTFFSFFDNILSTFDPQKDVKAIDDFLMKKTQTLFKSRHKDNYFQEDEKKGAQEESKQELESAEASFVLSVSNQNYFKIMEEIIPLRDLRDIQRKKTDTSYCSSQFAPTQQQFTNHLNLESNLKRTQRNYSLNIFRPSLIKQIIDFSNKQEPKYSSKNLKIQEMKLANRRRVSMFSKIRDEQIKYYQNINPFTLQSKEKQSKTQITSNSDSSQNHKRSNGMIFCPALFSNSKNQLKLTNSRKKNQKVRISLAVTPSSSLVRLGSLPNKTYCFTPIMQQENSMIINQQKKEKMKKGVYKMLLQSWNYRCQMIHMRRIQLNQNGWPYWFKMQGQYIKSVIFGMKQYFYVKKNIKNSLETLKMMINQKISMRRQLAKFQLKQFEYAKKKILDRNSAENIQDIYQNEISLACQLKIIETAIRKFKKTSLLDVILIWIHKLCYKKVKNNFTVFKINGKIYVCQWTCKYDNFVQFVIMINNRKKIKYIFKAKFNQLNRDVVDQSIKQLFNIDISPVDRWLSVSQIEQQFTTFKSFFMEKYTEKVYKNGKKFYRMAFVQYLDKRLLLFYEFRGQFTYVYFVESQEDCSLKSLLKKKPFMQRFQQYKFTRKQNTIYLQLTTDINQYIINLKTSDKFSKTNQKLHKKHTL